MISLNLELWDVFMLSNYIIRLVVSICVLLILKDIVKKEEVLEPHNGKVFTFFLAWSILQFFAALVEITGYIIGEHIWVINDPSIRSFYLMTLSTVSIIAIWIALRHIHAKEFDKKDWIFKRFHF